jgi:hypothetical protein
VVQLPMAILASISGSILFTLIKSTTGRISAYAFTVLFITNP